MLWGGELVLRDDVAVGQVTSAAWSTTLGTCVGLASVWRDDGAIVTPKWLQESRFAINAGGRIATMFPQLRGLFDPDNDRVRPKG